MINHEGEPKPQSSTSTRRMFLQRLTVFGLGVVGLAGRSAVAQAALPEGAPGFSTRSLLVTPDNNLKTVVIHSEAKSIPPQIVLEQKPNSGPTLAHIFIDGSEVNPDQPRYITPTGPRPQILPDGRVGIVNQRGEVVNLIDETGYHQLPLGERFYLSPQSDIIANDVRSSQGIPASSINVDIILDSQGQPGVAIMKQGPHQLDSSQLTAIEAALNADRSLVDRLEESNIDVIGQDPKGTNPVDPKSGTLYIPKVSVDPVGDIRNLEKFVEGAF